MRLSGDGNGIFLTQRRRVTETQSQEEGRRHGPAGCRDAGWEMQSGVHGRCCGNTVLLYLTQKPSLQDLGCGRSPLWLMGTMMNRREVGRTCASLNLERCQVER